MHTPDLGQVSFHLVQPSSSLCSPSPYAELGIAVEHLIDGALVRHPHDMPQPSYPTSPRHRQDARFAVQLSKLVHPSPPRSMLEHTVKDDSKDASPKHAQSVCILRSDGPGFVSVEDHRANQCAIYLTFCAGSKSSESQQSISP